MLDQALAFWNSLPYDYKFYAWLISGLCLLAYFLRLFYLLIRVRLLGQRFFRKNWYSDWQYQELLQILSEDHKSGHRVMRFDELELLRREMFGDGFKPLNKSHGGYM